MKKSYLLKKKKGVVDVQFNWIFVMIAGFVMFLFIISIIFKQQANSEKQSSVTSTNQITTLIKGKQQTSNVYSEIKIPQSDIEFKCDEETKYFTYRLGTYERVQLPAEVIFSRTKISTDKLIVWTQSFDLGFPVVIFSYITTPGHMIILYGDITNSDIVTLYDTIPPNISKVLTDEDSVINKYRDRVIVCYNDKCPAGYDYINIKPTPQAKYPSGEIEFRKNSKVKKVPYITDAAIYGAIFSNNGEYFSCQMKRAIDHYDIKRALLEKRFEIMIKPYVIDDTVTPIVYKDCGYKMKTVLDVQLAEITNLAQLTNYGPNNGIDPDLITTLTIKASSITTRNVDLRLSSCPEVY